MIQNNALISYEKPAPKRKKNRYSFSRIRLGRNIIFSLHYLYIIRKNNTVYFIQFIIIFVYRIIALFFF